MKKVMIIDDDKAFLDEISELLKLSGYETHFVLGGVGALKKIEEIKPDAIITDLKMHPVSGFKISAELRNNPEINAIPVIGITGFYTKGEHRPLMHICGINKCLIKPVKPLDIIAAIEGVLAEKNYG